MMRPGEVLDAQADLLTRVTLQPKFRQMMQGYLESQFGINHKTERTSPQLREQIMTIVDVFGHHVQAAEAYKVTKDMVEVLQVAAEQLDGLDAWDWRLAPTQCGFVHLDAPIKVLDIRGKTMLVNFIVWGPANQGGITGTMVWYFNDAWKDPDEVQANLLRAVGAKVDAKELESFVHEQGRWASVATAMYPQGQKIGPMAKPNTPDQIALVDLNEGESIHETTNLSRYLHALWLLLNQTIVATTKEKPERHFAKRALRHRLDPHVTTIQLRKIKGDHEGEGEHGQEYHVRWLVRGHWRNQPVGENYPGAFEISPGDWRARLWIGPFLKGNPDAPLKLTKKVYSLSR